MSRVVAVGRSRKGALAGDSLVLVGIVVFRNNLSGWWKGVTVGETCRKRVDVEQERIMTDTEELGRIGKAGTDRARARHGTGRSETHAWIADCGGTQLDDEGHHDGDGDRDTDNL